MTRSTVLAASIAALALAAAPAAHAAPPNCSRGGAKILAADGPVRIVSIAGKPVHSESRHDHIYGCRVPTGRRFTLLVARDFGLDLIEHDHFTIVQQRYIGVLQDFEGGASESQSATTWDTFTRTKLHDSKPCDSVDRGDFGGIDDVAFLPRGGLAYTCNQLRIADGHGDRQLEPAGTDVRNLAVSINSHDFSARLYWVVVNGATVTPKSLDLGA
jgi:hypothetical protein